MPLNSNPVAVVTGASTGIGKHVAISLLSKGWNVCLLARSLDKMQKIRADYKPKTNVFQTDIKIIQCDVTNPSQVLSACEEIKLWCNDKINLLLNNAGGGGGIVNRGLDTTTSDSFDNVINLNLRAPFLFTKYLKTSLINASKIPSMYNRTLYDGNVVNISSVMSQDATSWNVNSAYSVAKAGLNQLTRVNAAELALDKVRVNCILPAIIHTPAWDRNFSKEQLKDIMSKASVWHPIGRVGKSEDIAKLVMFLVDKEQAGWMTGTLLNLDGGFTLTTKIKSVM